MLTRYRSAASVVLGTLALLTAGLAASLQKPTANSSKQSVKPPAVRKIPCKVPENASSCYWAHGRLSVYNGNPTYRIWKIGTHRLLGVFNGPSHFPPRIASFDDDVFSPEFPATLDSAYKVAHDHSQGGWPPDVFADFEVCPLEPERKGEMQAVCIESAKNIFVQPD